MFGYLVKYTSKGEKASSVVNSAFTNVMQKTSDTSDMQSFIRQIMIKTVGQRDYFMQEVMHQLLSLKCVSATHEVVTASLDGSRRIQMARNGELCTTLSMLSEINIYSQFLKY